MHTLWFQQLRLTDRLSQITSTGTHIGSLVFTLPTEHIFTCLWLAHDYSYTLLLALYTLMCSKRSRRYPEVIKNGGMVMLGRSFHKEQRHWHFVAPNPRLLRENLSAPKYAPWYTHVLAWLLCNTDFSWITIYVLFSRPKYTMYILGIVTTW